MCPVNPRLPPTDREVPRSEDPPNDDPLDPNREPLIELPVSEALDPKCEPEVEELPKCEPSMLETARLGEIELRDAEEPSIELRPAVVDPLKFPAREFEATDGEFDPRAAPEAPGLVANERAVELPAVLPPACVPAVFPVLRALFAPAPELPENECQLPSAFARVAPRPAGQPDVRAFNEFERPALELAPFRAFAEFPPDRPPYAPFERAPPYPPYERPPPYMPPRPYEPIPRAALLGGPPRYIPPPPPRYAPPP
jgi:hypothetical protein